MSTIFYSSCFTNIAKNFQRHQSASAKLIEMYTDESATTRLAGATGASDVITGVAKTTYSISGLKPGTYFFRCDIHPAQMVGTFKVTG